MIVVVVRMSFNDDITTPQLFNFSSSVARSAINNSVAKMSRSCWASDIQERTVFHDSTVAVAPSTAYDRDFASNPAKVGYFAPLLMIGVRLAAAAPESAVSVQVLLEQTYYFTFRQPKYGGDPSATANVRSIPVMNLRRDARSLDREADMDDAGGLDDEAAQAHQPAAQGRRLQGDGEDPNEYLSPALQ